MTSFRHRLTVAVIVLFAAGLSACASDPTSPLAADSKQRVSADVDTTKRGPTLPWTSVQSNTGPTLPWN